MASFVGFGHSHIVALAKGCDALRRQGRLFRGAPIDGTFHYLYDKALVPALSPAPRENELNPEILARLNAGDARFILLSIGGNEHNALSIVQLHQRYDFILGENPTLPLEPGAEIYPEAVIRETLREWMADSLNLLRALRKASQRPMAQIEPPPPLPREQVLAYPQEFFKTAVETSKLSSDCLRHKMWRLQAALYREVCERIGIAYVAIPAELLDPRGMLVQAAWGCDATHANEWFGQRMIEEVMRRLSGKIAG